MKTINQIIARMERRQDMIVGINEGIRPQARGGITRYHESKEEKINLPKKISQRPTLSQSEIAVNSFYWNFF